jgi:hypothetical protein
MEVSKQIIEIIKVSLDYSYSDSGYTITIEGLDELMPDISRHLIVEALIDMDGVRVIDPATGAVHFPSSYFR